MPTCRAKSLAVPTGMIPSGTSYPSSPFTTSFNVPSPPAAATTSTPLRAASAAILEASPGSYVVSVSTRWPFARTQFTRWRTSPRSARAPWMINAICLDGMTSTKAYHAPVLATEVADLLRDCSNALDGTLGGGGHSRALLVAGVKHVVGVDRDPEAIVASHEVLREYAQEGRFVAYQSNYADIGEIDALATTRFDGILLDLG